MITSVTYSGEGSGAYTAGSCSDSGKGWFRSSNSDILDMQLSFHDPANNDALVVLEETTLAILDVDACTGDVSDTDDCIGDTVRPRGPHANTRARVASLLTPRLHLLPLTGRARVAVRC